MMACCGVDASGSRAAAPTPDRAAGSAAAGADPAADASAGARPTPACPPPAVAKLASYLDVRVPDVYWIEMVHGDHGWVPSETLRMPYHHATRLELTNLDGFPQLAGGAAGRVRFVVEITARDIRHDPDRATWFTTYHARILESCVVDGG
jgi:hypothetical protein